MDRILIALPWWSAIDGEPPHPRLGLDRFLTVPTAHLCGLFVLVVLAHHGRRIVHSDVPNAAASRGIGRPQDDAG